MSTFPQRINGTPSAAELARAFNQLLDWLRANQALPGEGIVTTPTANGLIFSVAKRAEDNA